MCATLGHSVPESLSMLPCSGKGHSDVQTAAFCLSVVASKRVETAGDATSRLPSQQLG